MTPVTSRRGMVDDREAAHDALPRSPPCSMNATSAITSAPTTSARPISVHFACLTKKPQSTDGSRE